jgi:hypothetical protein
MTILLDNQATINHSYRKKKANKPKLRITNLTAEQAGLARVTKTVFLTLKRRTSSPELQPQDDDLPLDTDLTRDSSPITEDQHD